VQEQEKEPGCRQTGSAPGDQESVVLGFKGGKLDRTWVMRHLPVVLSKAAIPTSLPVPLASRTAVIQVPSTADSAEVSGAFRLAAVIRLGARVAANGVSALVLSSSTVEFRPVSLLDMSVQLDVCER
jgi:hypothetical protein